MSDSPPRDRYEAEPTQSERGQREHQLLLVKRSYRDVIKMSLRIVFSKIQRI